MGTIFLSEMWTRPMMWLAPFLALAALLHLIPQGHREAGGDGVVALSAIERAGETFPGSAFFYAEDAFAITRPGARATDAQLPQTYRGNRHILAIDVGPAAAPYVFSGRSPLDRGRALSCMTNAIYYEAGNEPEEGQRAVAQVVLNRLRHPEWPDSVCGVIYQGTERSDLLCQFSFSCDGAMARVPHPEKWAQARRVAERALAGDVFAPAGLSTHYHTLAVRPGWSARLTPTAIIGAHIFYRMPGTGSRVMAFADRYSGIETAQPGPYAFVAPSKSSIFNAAASGAGAPAPSILVSRTEIAGVRVIRPALDLAPARQTGPTPATNSYAPPRVVPVSRSATDRLPQSKIRPEYHNSGTVLR